MKWIEKAHTPAEITMTTVTHVPFLRGYWEKSIDVLNMFFSSMRKNADEDYDLMVFDNGSCTDVQDLLVNLYKTGLIDYLILSKDNLGKIGAWNHLFAAAPGPVISYSDSDVYFLPGWLSESVRIIKAFPEAGLVTAQPIIASDMERSEGIKALKKDISVQFEIGRLIPLEYLVTHLKSINRFSEDELAERLKVQNDVRITRNGVSAYACASHFQFTTTKKRLAELMPFPFSGPLVTERDIFDKPLIDRGYLRLSTTHYLVHHMGNQPPDLQVELPWRKDLQEESPVLNAKISLLTQRKSATRPRWLSTLLQHKNIRDLLKKINTLAYELLYE